jgi:hypothetical protein
MRPQVWLLIILAFVAVRPAQAATICYTACASLDGWSVHTLGNATVTVVQDPLTGA